MTDLIKVPTLAEVVEHPELIDGLPAGVCGAMVVQIASLQQRLGARLAIGPAEGLSRLIIAEELLDVREAARRLGLAPKTLYRLVKRAPMDRLVVNIGLRRAVRLSSLRIEEYLRQSQQSNELGSRHAQPIRPPRGNGTTARPAPSPLRDGSGGV